MCFSADGNGQLRASFSALFQPTLQTPTPRVEALMGATISDLNYTLTDPQTGNVFRLQAEGTTGRVFYVFKTLFKKALVSRL